MKKRKLNFALCTAMLLGVFATVGCGPTSSSSGSTSAGGSSGDVIDADGFHSDAYYAERNAVIPEGFTSLANTNANAPVRADGKYVAGGIEFDTKKEFRTTYTTDPKDSKFNYLTNTWTYNSEHYCNMVDGLVENDKYGNIVGALAKAYTVKDNADGTQTWTFKLKEGVRWVKNADETTVAEVKAQDFVTAIKYVLTPLNASGTVSIVTSFLKNAEEYFEETISDFSQVGVKAVDDYTLEYTLIEPTPYFITGLTYSPFLPLNEDFLEEQGSDFGTNENAILVNGAFRLTKFTASSSIEYTKNQHYYDKDHVYFDKVVKKFVPGTATATDLRGWYESNLIDSFTVNTTDEEGYRKYVSGADGTGTQRNPAHNSCNGILSSDGSTYIGYWNFNRGVFEYADNRDAKTAAQKKATSLALMNKDFRVGFLHGLDVLQYLKMVSPKEPYARLARAYTSRELCSANNKDYVDMVCAVYNQKQGTTGVNLTGIEQGGDPVFDATKAGQYFARAKTALKAAGLTEADFPIRIDVIGDMDVQSQPYDLAMFKAVEDASNGLIDIVYNIPRSDEENGRWGSQVSNFDFSMWSGWGPDYADPNTFLHTTAVDGDFAEYFGFEETQLHPQTIDALNALGKSSIVSAADPVQALEEEIMGAYNAKYLAGAKITDATRIAERYQKFAEAEYSLIYEEGLIVPWFQKNGYYAVVANTIPFQAGKASYGLQDDKLKNVIVTASAITKEQRASIVTEYNKK